MTVLKGWEDYVDAGLGGAAGGWALLYTGPIGAGAVGGAVSNLTKQGLKNLTGKQNGKGDWQIMTLIKALDYDSFGNWKRGQANNDSY